MERLRLEWVSSWRRERGEERGEGKGKGKEKEGK